MKTCVMLAMVSAATVAQATPLVGYRELAGFDVPLTDPVTFTPTTADVYHLVVHNPNPVNVYTYSLDLRGGPYFVSTQSVGIDFPQLGPFTVADSFLVRNAGAPNGAVNPIGITDTETRLSGTVTVLAADPTNGNAPVADVNRIAVPAGGTSVLAVVAVPSGTVLPFWGVTLGTAVVDGVLEPIIDILPEPSAALMVCLALVGYACGQRKVGA